MNLIRIFKTIKHPLFWILCLCCTIIIPAFATVDNTYEKNLPKPIKEHIYKHFTKSSDGIKVVYVMKWNGYKVYQIIPKEYGIIFDNPVYILCNRKEIHKLNAKEYNKLCYDVRIHSNKIAKIRNKQLERKLLHNAKKVMTIDDNTPPPEIPKAVYEYINKYMFKENVNILYIMDWNGQHVYWVCCPKYGVRLHNFSVILYDGHTLRRPDKEEFELMLPSFREAYEKYLIELGHQHNKD